MTTPLLEVRGLSVAFGGKEVVHGIDFTVPAGQKLALVGESGSGKTVSALSLLGLVPNARVSGSAMFEGEGGAPARDLLALPERELLAIRGREIAMIFQEPMTALNPLYTVGDQIAEVLQLKEGLTGREAWSAAVEALRATGIPEPARRAGAYPHQLSGGQRQRAMIAMALAGRPRLLLADEPTTALDVTVRAQILDLLSELQHHNGMAMLLITHDLNLVRRFADRVAVMENGHLVEQGTVDEVFSNPQHPYNPQADRQPAPAQRDRAKRCAPGTRDAGQRHGSELSPHARGISRLVSQGRVHRRQGRGIFDRACRTLGVVGESGSGKSTLALAALGLMPHRGELDVVGRRWGPDAAGNKAIRRLVQVVFQDPFSSLSPRMTVEEIVGEGLLVHEPRMPLPQRRERVIQALDEVGLGEVQFPPACCSAIPMNFPAASASALAIARALIVQPQLLILDEPTSALDVTIQKQVLALLMKLQKEKGLSYLLITHDVDVIRAMAHDVMVMKDGAIVESGPALQLLDAPREEYTRTLVAAAS
jgi:microcin C transport system ATP-binding protein